MCICPHWSQSNIFWAHEIPISNGWFIVLYWYLNGMWMNYRLMKQFLCPFWAPCEANSAISGAEAPEGRHPGPQRGRWRHCHLAMACEEWFNGINNDINNGTMTLTVTWFNGICFVIILQSFSFSSWTQWTHFVKPAAPISTSCEQLPVVILLKKITHIAVTNCY